MKIELEIPDEVLNKYISTAIKQQIDKRIATYARNVVASYETAVQIKEQIKEQIKAEVGKNVGPQVEKAIGNWEKIRPQIMEAAEKAIVNRTSRMIKKLEEV